MKTIHLIAIGALGLFSSLLQDIAQGRERYLESGAPRELAIEATPQNPWLAISELPPLDMGDRVVTNITKEAKSPVASQETPKFTEMPGDANPYGPAAPPAEPTAAELLSHLKVAPGDTNGINLMQLNFVPPARPSSTATYTKTK